MWTWAAAIVCFIVVTFGGSSGMAEDAVLAVRGMIFGGDLDLLKGLITEHDIPVEDIEAVTKTQAVTLVDKWFVEQTKDKDKALLAIHSLMETLEKKPVGLVSSAIDTSSATGATKLAPFRKDLKISGQIDCKMGISYTSLRRQIENAKAKGYKDIDIIDAVIKAIPPTSGLRRYLEGKELLTLDNCIQILRAHYNEKSATELYNELGQLTQQTKESSSEFLMRALEVKQKVIYASNESTEDMKYTKELIQTLFVRTVTTGLSNITIRQEFKPYLEKKEIKDEELIETLNKIVSRENERQSKFSKVKVNELKEDKEEKMEMRTVRAEIAELREAVERLTTTKSSVTLENKKTTPRLCQQCQELGSKKCNHCWRCGSEEHYSRGCRKVVKPADQENSSRSHQGGKV